MSLAAAMLNRPPKPPMSPTTSGRYVECTVSLMASTARAPSAVSTPAAWYVTSCFVTGCSLSDRREPNRPCGQRSRTVNLPKPGHLGTYPYLSGFARTADRKRRTENTPPPPFTWRQAAQLRTLNATSPNCSAARTANDERTSIPCSRSKTRSHSSKSGHLILRPQTVWRVCGC